MRGPRGVVIIALLTSSVGKREVGETSQALEIEQEDAHTHGRLAETFQNTANVQDEKTKDEERPPGTISPNNQAPRASLSPDLAQWRNDTKDLAPMFKGSGANAQNAQDEPMPKGSGAMASLSPALIDEVSNRVGIEETVPYLAAKPHSAFIHVTERLDMLLPFRVNLPASLIFNAAVNGVLSEGKPLGENQLNTLLFKADSRLQGMKQDKCNQIAKTLIQAGSPPSHAGSHIVHTGFVGFDDSIDSQLAARKLRLSVLSFLATQNLDHTKLWVWLPEGTDMQSGPLHEAFAPVLTHREFSKSLSFKTFVADNEFGKLKGFTPQDQQHLRSLYGGPKIRPASKSDLQRISLLHNYGGLWMDSDVLLVRDMTPLMDLDWAYLGQPGFVNGAILSVSSAQNMFTTKYLEGATTAQTGKFEGNVYEFGPVLLGKLRFSMGDVSTFHVLPCCFFDGAWCGSKHSTGWNSFFTKPASPERIKYVVEPRKLSAPFAYHWHGRWKYPILEGSLADCVEQIHLRRLGLAKTVSSSCDVLA